MGLRTRNWDRLGNGGLTFTELGFGTAPLGNLYKAISDDDARATLDAAWEGGVRYFDTAPLYGLGLSETRLNPFLRDKPRDSYILSSKVGRLIEYCAAEHRAGIGKWFEVPQRRENFDYTYDGVMRSYEDSLARLGLARVDCLAVHDLDPRHQKSEAGVAAALDQLEQGRGFAALRELKEQGEIGAIGAGINEVGMISRFVERFEMDYFLIASPYNLLEQTALAEDLPLCEEHGIGVVLGAVFASGILASGSRAGAKFRYQAADTAILERVREIDLICQRHGVPLTAAALQFPLHHGAVNCIIPGANHPDQVTANLAAYTTAIPDDLWRELKQQGHLPLEAPTPG